MQSWSALSHLEKCDAFARFGTICTIEKHRWWSVTFSKVEGINLQFYWK